jgi:molybdopterin-guanine dinucleotide biosynthesis protein A
MLTIERIFLSPGHNFFGHHGRPAGTNDLVAVDEIECVAGRGLRGDRFFDYKPDYKGQVTLFSAEVFETLRAAFSLPEVSPAALRRNLLVRGADLNGLIGKSFELQGVRLEGVEECRPCHWMDQALAPGAETWLRGRGGLRCRILTDGWLRRDNRWSALETTRSLPAYSGYVLAGGVSRRMGRDKAELPIHGEPFWRRQVRVLGQAGANPVTLVRAPHQPTLSPEVPEIHDAIANIGPLAGLHAALTHASATAVAVLAIDMPAIDAGWFRWLRTSCSHAIGAVACQHGRFEPLAAIYPRSALPFVTRQIEQGSHSLQALMEILIVTGLMRAVPLAATESWRAANWNTPRDRDQALAAG